MSETTICGGCNFRVSVKLQHQDDHNCILMQELKKSFNFVLSDIQKDYEHKIQEINGTIRNHRSLNAHLESEIAKLKKELSTCIDVKLLYSDRQARETWQTGCEVMIETLRKRVADMDWMLKQSLGCVDNSHADENAKRFGLPTLDKLANAVKQELKIHHDSGRPDNYVFSKIKKDGDRHILVTQSYPFEEDVEVRCVGTGSIKVHHPSRKHLENKLREKNERIKQLTEKNIELEHKVTELLVACRDSHRKDDRIVNLSEALGGLQRENDQLRMHANSEKCRKPCCLPSIQSGCYV